MTLSVISHINSDNQNCPPTFPTLRMRKYGWAQHLFMAGKVPSLPHSTLVKPQREIQKANLMVLGQFFGMPLSSNRTCQQGVAE